MFSHIMVKILFRIANTARLPMEFSKGNVSERVAKSRQLSKRLHSELEKSSNYTDNFILNSISKVLAPYNINTTIEPNKLHTRGGHRLKLEVIKTDVKKNEIETAVTSHIISLPPNPKDRDKYTILHEAGHLFDSALNPKSMRCDYIKLVNKDDIYNTLQEMKNRFLSISDVKKLKRETPQILKDIPDEYAIDALQNLRCHLETERNQYGLGLKMMLKDGDIPLDTFIEEVKLYCNLKFNQKLRFVNKLLKERISEVRKIIKLKTCSNSVS